MRTYHSGPPSATPQREVIRAMPASAKTIEDLEKEGQALMGVPEHKHVFPPPPPIRDPETLHAERVRIVPGTNRAILAGGLDG